MKNFKWDILFTLLFSLILFACFNYFDAFEGIYELTRKYEQFELDEFFLLFLSIPIPLIWFAYRRVEYEKKQYEALVRMEYKISRKHRLEALGVLAGGIAHEINNQLQPILAMTDLVQKNMSEDDPNRRKIELIFAGAEKAKKTIAKIKNFSRQQEEHKQCEIFETFREIKELILTAKPGYAKINFNIANEIGWVKISAENIHGMVFNLVNNALDSLEEKSGEVGISLDIVDNQHHIQATASTTEKYARIVVDDSGIGMSKTVKDKIFNPFFTTKPMGKGVGLGLSIVYTGVNQAGGEISVESQQGSGSKVSVYLPLIGDLESIASN